MISILRIGHRASRDERVTTHVCLVARALGADEVIIIGGRARNAINSFERVQKDWGGSMRIREGKNWRKEIEEWKEKGGMVVHLTMYGEEIQDKIDEIRNAKKDVMVVVGAEKVPSEIYQLADYNIAITNQPHSEIAALAIFLHMYFEGKELELSFEGAKRRIIPSARGKRFAE